MLMPRFGKHTVVITNDTVVVDFLDETDFTGNNQSTENSAACVQFKAADPNKRVIVSFEYVDMNSPTYGSSYKAFIKMYEGACDDGEYTWPEAYGDVTTLLPGGGIDSLSGTHENLTYIATRAEGLSIGFLYKYASKSKGFKATVSCVEDKAVEITEAGSLYNRPERVFGGDRQVNVLSYYWVGDGLNATDHITALDFKVKDPHGILSPDHFKLYASQVASLAKETPLEAILEQTGDVYTFKLNHPVSQGRNVLSIGADVSADAAAMGKTCTVTAVAMKTVQHPQGVAVFQPAASVPDLEVPYVVMMAPGVKTLDIAFNTLFYDDGGPDGNIMENFEGMVVLKPTTPGRVIQVDFSKLDLFNTNPDRNDVLNIYNGSFGAIADLKASALNVRLLKEKTARVRSMAADGSLTVYLKSTTGVTKSGFEAEISEYEPAAMRFVSANQYCDATQTGAQGDELMLLGLNIRTEDILNPLTLDALTLDFSSSKRTSVISGGTVYYMGKDSVFNVSKAEKIGTFTLAGTTAVVAMNEAKPTLSEGVNYVYVQVVLNDEAVAGDTVSAYCPSLTLGGEAQAVAKPSLKGIGIDNIYYAKNGTHTKAFKREIGLAPTPYLMYAYEPSMSSAQVVTFVPKGKADNPAIISQIDFSSFDLYAGSSYSSYRDHDVFKVYSGSGTAAENLLWEYKGGADAATEAGPGRILRSEAADGALTIEFQAKASYGSQCGKGFSAVVSEYIPVPVAIASAVGFQADSLMVSQAAGKEKGLLLGLKLQVSGTLDHLNWTGLTIHWKDGCHTAVDKADLYITQTDVFDPATAPVATGTVASAQTSFTGGYALTEGTYWIWLTADVKAGMPSGTRVDAVWSGLTTSDGKAVAIENADPAGAMEIRAVYLLHNGAQDEIQVNPGEPLMFYDDGGPDGNFSTAKWNGKVTFVPPAGYVIRMIFNSLCTGGVNNTLSVYAAGDTLPANRLGEYYASQYTDKGPKPTDKLQSRSEDGCMTAQFITKSSAGNQPGWEIEVSAIKPRPHCITALQATAVPVPFVGSYSSEVEILKMKMPVSGDKGKTALTALSFDLTGTTVALSNLQVYFTGADTALVAATAEEKRWGGVGDLSNEVTTVTLNGMAEVDWEQDYYLFVTYSLAEAVAGDKIAIRLAGAVADDGTAIAVTGDAATHIVAEGMHGRFIVGTSAQAAYPSLQKAVDALQNGVDGAVEILLEDGEYTEKVTVGAIPGLSERNTLTIASLSGDAEKVTLTHHSFSGGYGEPDRGVLNLNGCAFVTVRDLGFYVKNASGYENELYVYNAAHHITLAGLRMVREKYTGSPSSCYHIQVYGNTLEYAKANCAYIRVTDCYFENGKVAVNVGGSGYVNAVKDPQEVMARYVEIDGNRFSNFGDKAVYLHDVAYFSIKDNDMLTDYVQSSTGACLDLYRGMAGQVSGNSLRMDFPANKRGYGIQMRPVYGTAETPTRIYNNAILFNNVSGAAYGINFWSGPIEYVEVAHNTVGFMSGNAAASACVFFDKNVVGQSLHLTNNLFQNKAGGYVYYLKKAEDAAAVVWKNNGVFTSVEANFAYVGGDKTYAEWQAAVATDQDAQVAEAEFLNENMLGLKTLALFNQTTPLAWVKTDIFGTERPASGATMGAYEFEGDLDQAPRMETGYPKLEGVTAYTADLSVRMNQSGSVYGYAVETDAETEVTADKVLTEGMRVSVGRNQEVRMRFTGLADRQAYKVYFVLKNNNAVQNPDLVVSEPFMTDFKPTEISTFEEVALGDYADGFESGTAFFRGFGVMAADDEAVGAPQGDHRALAVGEAEIRILNTDTGLNLTGFYYKSKQATALTLVNSSATSQLTLPASSTWRYFGLRGKGRAHTLRLAATDSLWLDDFSGSPLALTVSALYSDTAVNKGETIVLGAVAQGGVPDYTYRWQDGGGTSVAQAAEWTLTVERTAIYTIEIQDAWDNVATARVQVVAKGGEGIADFEGLLAKAESNWHGELDGANRFYSGSFRFDNTYNAEYDSWSGYACANLSGNTYVPAMGYGNQYKNAAGGGADGSASYGLIYNRGVATYVGGEDGVPLQGVYVTNNTMLVNAVEEGDSWVGEPFGTGDYFKAVFKGTSPDGEETAMEYYLADYRDENPDEHYVLTTWEWVDLSALGTVKSLSVSFEGSRSNEYGQTLPHYMAIDNLNGGYAVTERTYEVQVGMESALTFAGVFELPGDGRWTVETLEAGDAAIATVTMAENGLKVAGLSVGTTRFVLKARRNGRTAYVGLNVAVTREPAATDAPRFTPAGGEVPAGTAVSISCATDGAVIYYTADGSEPTESSTVYTSAIVVEKAMTIKAFALKSGMKPSRVESASYTVKTAPQISDDASLRLLSLDQGTLTPAFSPEVYRYTVNVPNKVEQLMVMAEATHAAAKVEGAGRHALGVGANAIAVTVTAEDGVTQCVYRLVVTRAVAPTDPDDSTANEAGLSSVLVSVYPNPTADAVRVEVAEPALLEVFGLDGRVVFRQAVGAGVQTVTLDKSGIYVVRVTAGDRVAVKRLVRR